MTNSPSSDSLPLYPGDVVVLDLAKPELTFFRAVHVMLCFRFVIKMVQTTHQCFRYGWPVPKSSNIVVAQRLPHLLECWWAIAFASFEFYPLHLAIFVSTHEVCLGLSYSLPCPDTGPVSKQLCGHLSSGKGQPSTLTQRPEHLTHVISVKKYL